VNVAFYAPLKAPDHPTPSGDRAVARMLLRALRACGHRVSVVSRLRSYEGEGNAQVQDRIRRRADATASRLVARLRAGAASERPAVWFTYHLYHKAPDLLGPAISEALGIPYVVAEASHAPKQRGGPWDAGFRAAARAIERAAQVICLNPGDEPCVRALLRDPGRMQRLAPFIDARASVRRADPRTGERLRREAGMSGEGPVLVTVAMMRHGDKLASYRVLGNALRRIAGRPWRLLVIGDGPARAPVQHALRGLSGRVHYAGQVPARELPAWLAGCDLHLWPAVNEAWGMAFLETAAAALASVAGDERGVSSVVRDGRSGLLTAPRDAAAFADAVTRLLDDRAWRDRLGRGAREDVLAKHDLAAAARRLDRILSVAVGP
jgi:glycosyltransferase involved in cell wall biosynthesis